MARRKTPQERAEALRAQAAQIEREAEEERIRTTCFFHGFAWSSNGLCYSVWGDTEPCVNHFDSYNDDYGVQVSCHHCNSTNGTIHVRRKLREPEWDAPQPPDDRRTIL